MGFDQNLMYRIVFVKIKDKNSPYKDKYLKGVIKKFYGKGKEKQPYRIVFGKSTQEGAELSSHSNIMNENEIMITNKFINKNKAVGPTYKNFYNDSNELKFKKVVSRILKQQRRKKERRRNTSLRM